MSEIVRVSRGDSALAVDLNGGHITELIIHGRQIFYSGYEGDKRRAGHLAWHYFGSPEQAGFPKGWPKHGFARRAPWKLIHSDNEQLAIKIAMGHTDEMREAGIPDTVNLDMWLAIADDRFNWDVTTFNVSRDRDSFQERIGFHPYFVVSGILLSDHLDTLGADPAALQDGQPIRRNNPGIFLFTLPGLGTAAMDSDAEDLPDLIIWTSGLRSGYLCVEPCRLSDHEPLKLGFGSYNFYRLRLQVEE